MSELNHETFDLGSAITGVSFPEDEVTVYFDESIGYAIHKAEEELRLAEIRGNEDRLKELDSEIQDLKKKARDLEFKVTVRGLPESTRKACDQKSREKFPVETTFLGTVEPNPDRNDYYESLLWAASIVKVTDSKGRVSLPTEENIRQLRESAGRTVVEAISRGIGELVTGTRSGFEKAAQDVDFLSGASLAE